MDVRITAREDRGGIDWEIEGKKPKKSRIEFKENEGKTNVRFKLDDETGRGLRFDCRNPFSDQREPDSDVIDETAPCPPDGACSDETDVLSCDSDKLTVLNKNSTQCIVRYKLHFIDGAGASHCVDPEFKNGVRN